MHRNSALDSLAVYSLIFVFFLSSNDTVTRTRRSPSFRTWCAGKLRKYENIWNVNSLNDSLKCLWHHYLFGCQHCYHLISMDCAIYSRLSVLLSVALLLLNFFFFQTHIIKWTFNHDVIIHLVTMIMSSEEKKTSLCWISISDTPFNLAVWKKQTFFFTFCFDYKLNDASLFSGIKSANSFFFVLNSKFWLI